MIWVFHKSNFKLEKRNIIKLQDIVLYPMYILKNVPKTLLLQKIKHQQNWLDHT